MTETDEESWAQTLIAITPEFNGLIRTIKSDITISGKKDISLKNDPASFSSRKTIFAAKPKFIDDNELEKKSYRDVENQTYLQGVPKVQLPFKYRDEATQTLYSGKIRPEIKHFQEIITTLNEKTMPLMKISEITQTIITFNMECTQDDVVQELQNGISDDENYDPQLVVKANEDEETEIEVSDILNFMIDRVIWIGEPTSTVVVKKMNQEIQTILKYHKAMKKMFMDNETQTGLTCKPKDSNTKLIAEYKLTTDYMRNYLEECFQQAVHSLTVANDIIDDLVDKCAERVHFPPRNVATQTIAPCKVLEDKDDELLRKLKLPITIDPFESSIIVIPIANDILEAACNIVCQKAHLIVNGVIKRVVDRSSLIGIRLDQIRKDSQKGKPIEDIFTERRRKLSKLMLKSKTDEISTQTSIAGVPEVTKIQEPKETLCSVCKRDSICHVCLAAEKETDLSIENIKILRTQDILLTYNPCYVIATKSETAKNPALVPTCRPKIEEKAKLSQAKLNHKIAIPCESANIIDQSTKRHPKKISKESLSGWSHVVDTSLSKTWSMQSPTSSESKSMAKIKESSSKFLPERCSMSQGGLALRTIEALDILKNTFCTRETCESVSLSNSCNARSREDRAQGKLICKRQDKIQCVTKESRNRTKEKQSDGFKVIPIRIISDSDS
ncbi:uncharacterized protein LOC107264995 [Cephus cinctus]|uniref:Uncharacterized protein LOC107264995 n=1 Tax=Cephus cinctus TaxID=211228 RepID=A0AAJ7VZF2_CEPCN|nr:uncharacterized protein LOC107264995 [Cephus cinctus]